MNITPVITPQALKKELPLAPYITNVVSSGRTALSEILSEKSKRFIVITGPCSIHDSQAAFEYAEKLAALQLEVSDKVLLVMRTYFAKPRSTMGWKGLVYDPGMDDTFDFEAGVRKAREVLIGISAMSVPVAFEVLDPFTTHYFDDLLSYGAIGARTAESQPHRELASALSFPVGIKNSTDGSIQAAVEGVVTATHPHHFWGINVEGVVSKIESEGNPHAHVILRGGKRGPNYAPEFIKETIELLKKNNLPESIIVDCSHGNSQKDYKKQAGVLTDVVEQRVKGSTAIKGIMLESNLKEGKQEVGPNLIYGVSVTDACVSWEETEVLIRGIVGDL
ncbi:MAG: 3-deoxy-7-phosphoheptulonate synthase [Patescibacteria group bacterium]